ncbi:hypothetical protein [Paraburkholderia sp. J11-2]|uniref:hypothetical protein n=1 Tax=Paraburkholderia sp. J11-2 TaxID=2805431 RepID=UPI002AB6A0A2|nr:hypothetical protein [Paraburkholderia sp. J11-2]
MNKRIQLPPDSVLAEGSAAPAGRAHTVEPDSIFRFADHLPRIGGVEATICGQKLMMPALLMHRGVELTEATERAGAGEMAGGAFLRLRNQIIEETLRRNYPTLPDSWFQLLDAADYMELFEKIGEAASLGKTRAVSH